MVRRLNLVKEDGELDRAASLRLYARMLWPNEKDRAKRYAYIRSQSEPARLSKKGTNEPRLTGRDHESRMRRGGNAGDLLIYFLQMNKHRTAESARASLRRVVPYTRGAHLHDVGLDPAGLPPADELTTVEWHDTRTRLADSKVGRTALLKDFEEFRTVAHFWAVLILAQWRSTDGPDFWEGPDKLLRFVVLSERILEWAMTTPFDKPTWIKGQVVRRRRGVLIPESMAVRAILPSEPYETIRRSLRFELPPIDPEATRRVKGLER